MTDLSILILMGGQNTRMNGLHKAFLTVDGTSFVDYLIQSLAPTAPIYLSVNDLSVIPDSTYPLVLDIYQGIGPISGIYSGLKAVESEYLFVTGCDMPFVNTTLIKHLYSHLTPTTTCVVLRSSDGHLFPLAALYSKKMLPRIQSQIESGNYKLATLFEPSSTCFIDLETVELPSKTLQNVNTPESYQLLLKQ